MRSEAETVLQALKEMGNEIPKAERLLFTSLVEDNKKMEKRMTALEKKVGTIDQKVNIVDKKVDSIISDQQVFKTQLNANQKSIEHLTTLVKASIDQQKEKTKMFSRILQNKWFWLFAIIAIILIAGGSAADLLGIIKIER